MALGAVHIALALALAGAEAPPDEGVAELGTVDVEAPPSTANREVASEPTAFAEVIEVDRYRGEYRTVAELLDRASGVHVRSFGGLGALQTMSIRGSSAEQVAIFIDGVRLAPGPGGAVDLSRIPLEHVERIEIVRGSDSARFGESAMGGAVHIVTRKGRDGLHGRTSAAAGVYENNDRADPIDTTTLDASAGYGGANWRGFLSVAAAYSNGAFRFENDNGTDLDGSDDYSDVRDNNAFRSIGILANGSRALTDELELDALADLYLARKGIPGMITFPTPRAEEDDARAIGKLGLAYRPDWLAGSEHTAAARILHDRIRYEDPDPGIAGFAQRTRSALTTYEGELASTVDVTEVHRIRASLRGREETLDDPDFDDPRRASIFGSASDEIRLAGGKVTILPAASLQGTEDFPPLASARLGARYDPVPPISLKANAGTGFRLPGFAELYANQGFVTGNPSLDPETSRSVDAGILWTHSIFHIEAVAFWTDYRDLIVYLLQSGFQFKPFNVGRAQSAGWELAGAVEPASFLRLSGAWTYDRAVDRSGDANWRGNQVPGRPRNKANARVEFRIAPFRVYGEYAFVGRNFVTRSNTKLLDERHLLGAGIIVTPAEGVDISIEGRNLTDQRALDLRGIPLESRAYYAGVTVTW
ncbi:MAG: TonB-dependent receptor [Planctomycetes bacterium]|nr:TonB-dependent receptor [Planctomycetota bacterium]